MSEENLARDFSKLTEQFKALAGNQGLMIQLLEEHPVPLEIFAPDGAVIFANRAILDLNKISDANLLVGKYNLKNDPVCLKVLGQETIDRIFNGESVTITDFPAPVADVVDRGLITEKPWKAATMDMELLPLWDGDAFVHTVCFFFVKNKYQGRLETQKVQEYIEEHWLDELDLEKVAHYVSMSSRHLRRIFIEDTGNTPVEFYQRIKIDKLKEKLFDGNLSIEQAFEACGVVYRGAYYDLFKDKVGMTPAEYRKKNNIT